MLHTSRGQVNDSIAVDEQLAQEASPSRLDVSQAARHSLGRAIAVGRKRRWKAENTEAIQSDNGYVAKHGPSLAKYRLF